MLSSSITKAISGLHAAQKGLQVTGHNISNANTKGYTRQQLLQSESPYQTIGSHGGYTIKVGLGVTQDEIRQVRDDLADRRLRTENSVLCYYQKLNGTTSDIEAIFDEPYGDTISEFLNNFWSQAQKLNTAPDGVEERQSFISSAKVLIDKMNSVYHSLTDYQHQLENELQSSVKRVNQIADEIRKYNKQISELEVNGDRANDYRDQRNLLLDELSQYGNISYLEEADGQIQVKFEGHAFINRGSQVHMIAKEVEGTPYSKLIWSDSKEDVFELTKVSSSGQGNDTGSLKAILIARGNTLVTGDTTWDEIALNTQMSVDVAGNAYIIPKIQKMLGEFANQLVNLVNDSFNGTGIGAYKGQKGVAVFVPITGSDQENLVLGNIQVNPELLEGGGYNKLGTVAPAQDGSDSNADNASDNTLISDFLNKWNTSKKWFEGEGGISAPYEKAVPLTKFFSELVTDIGVQGSSYRAKATEKNISVTNIENERQSIGAVSTDEEFSNLLRYQYAYNASARMVTILDGMLDTLVNKL